MRLKTAMPRRTRQHRVLLVASVFRHEVLVGTHAKYWYLRLTYEEKVVTALYDAGIRDDETLISALVLVEHRQRPVVNPNIRDASGTLIHPLDCSKFFSMPMPVAVEVVTRLWTFAAHPKKPAGSRIYQTILKSLRLLPLTGPPKELFTSAATRAVDPNGK
ncbi:hypothetical protein DFH29DRAFT_1073241 [Suillus ampliporus]|nr:hypothetical protein DFH29DRAFT_1073241 [Suillus ampliporus]